MKIYRNYPLLKHNTFGIDVQAACFAEYTSIDGLRTLLAADLPRPLLHIGSGSNLLFTGDFSGTILHSRLCFTDITPCADHTVRVRVGAAVLWDDFCADMAARGYYGSENLSLIPGETGAAAVQNIGAYGAEVANIIDAVETVRLTDGCQQVFAGTDCAYGYRSSIFKTDLKGRYAVTAVQMRLSTVPRVHLEYGQLRSYFADHPHPTANEVRHAVIEIRRSKLPDPQDIGSAGSFFKNPIVPQTQFLRLQAQYPTIPHYDNGNTTVKIPAAWLIEQCGWKGQTHGGAAVYDKQPLVIVNQHHATSRDIVELADMIQQSVKERFDVIIEPEVNYI